MKAKYAEIEVSIEPRKNLCGYVVVGDIASVTNWPAQSSTGRRLILQRPEKAATERKPRKANSRAAKPEAQAVV